MSEREPRATHAERRPAMSAERIKAFIDAVVAIAMTLLILPLMESVSDTASAGEDTWHWLQENNAQLTSFVISFVIIAMFWSIHHRLFAVVERVTNVLLWVTFAWMLTIVWLPVATALTGQIDTDPLQMALYIGSLILTSLITLAIRWYLMRHPALHDATPRSFRRGMAVDLAMALLFSIALTLSIAFPALSYFPLFVLMLTGPLQRVIARMLRAD